MTIADFIKGKSSKKIYFWYYLVVLSVFWVFFYFSLDAYPIPYRVRINQISHLGSPRLNPNGHHFFNIGMVFFGISVIPHLLFLYRKHERFMHITSTMALISAIAVCVGLVLLPLYPVDNWDPHEVLASIIFIGFMVVVVCYCYIWILKIRKEILFVQNLGAFIIYSGMIYIIVLFIINLNTYWEWIYFISMLIYIFLILFFLPTDSNKPYTK